MGELLRQASLFLQRLFIHRLQDCRVLKSFDLHTYRENDRFCHAGGNFYGFVGQVEGIVNRIKAQSKEEPLVIATGGLANLIAGETQIIDVVDPF